MTASLLVLSLLATMPATSPPPGTAAGTAAPIPSLPTTPHPALDAGDDQYQFVAGLYEKGLHEMVVREARTFLDEYGGHAKAPLARYRLALSLFELDKPSDAAPHFDRLTRIASFEYRGESALRLAQCHLAADQLAKAKQALQIALESDAAYLQVPATFLLGETRFRGDEFAEAAKSYAKVVAQTARGESSDYGKRARLGLTWCAYRQGDFPATLAAAQEFLRQHAGDDLAGEVRFLEGEALLELGRPEEALGAFKRVDGVHGDGALRGAGFALAALDRAGPAAQAFGQLLERFPESPYAAEAAFHRGVQLLESGNVAEARAALSDPRVPQDAETLYWRGWAEFRDNAAETAQATLERALRERPEGELNGRIQSLRGDVLRALGREGDALAAYRSSGSDYSLYAAAVASINAGNADDAVRIAGELLEQHPQSPYRARAELALGEGLFLGERWSDAEAAFGRAQDGLEEDADRTRCASRLAWCRYMAGDLAAAATGFEAVARSGSSGPEIEEALFMSARAHLDAGNADPARRSLARYLERYKDGAQRDEALLELARLSGETGLLEQLLRETPNSPRAVEATYELAEGLAAAGNCASAKEHYRRLSETHPDHSLAAPALYGLAWCHYDSAEYDEAVAALRSFQRGAPPELLLSGLELLVFSECARERPRDAVASYERFAGLCKEDQRTFGLARTLAQALRDAGEPKVAQQVLEDCLARVEDQGVMADALVEGVYLSLERDDLPDAEARARVAQRRAPDDPAVSEALFFVAEKHFDAGSDAKAAELYREAAAVPGSPIVASALYKQGFALLRGGDAKAAAAAFETLSSEHSDDPLCGESVFLAAEARYRLGEFDAVVEHVERLRRGFPRHEVMPKALFRGGVALCQLERWKDAQTLLADLSRRFPDFENGTEAELWRGRALGNAGDRRGARQAFERVAARDRGVLAAQARLELGHLRLAADELEGALSEYLKVAVLFASGEEVAEALWMAGQCLERLDDAERAGDQYRELLESHASSPFAARARERLQRL